MSARVVIYTPEPVTFGPEAVVEAVYAQTVDVICGRLPEATLELTLYSEKPLALQKEEKVELYWDGRLCTTQHAYDCVRMAEALYKVSCHVRLSYLQTDCFGGMYSNTPALPELEQLLVGRTLEVDIPLTSGTLTGYIPKGSRESALVQMLFSLGATAVVAPGGHLRLRVPQIEDAVELLPGRLQARFPIRYQQAYSRFELAAHSYTKGTQLVKVMDKVEYPGHQVTLTFTRPYWFYTMPSEPGGEIVDEGPNYVVIDHYGIVTLEARPYLHEAAWHTLPGSVSDDPDYSHVMTVRDMTLVGSHNAQRLLERLREMGTLRQLVQAQYLVRAGEELPLPGDKVTLRTPWGVNLWGYIQEYKMRVAQGQAMLQLTVSATEA